MMELKQQIQSEYIKNKKQSDRMSNTKLIVFAAAVFGFILGAVFEPIKLLCYFWQFL